MAAPRQDDLAMVERIAQQILERNTSIFLRAFAPPELNPSGIQKRDEESSFFRKLPPQRSEDAVANMVTWRTIERMRFMGMPIYTNRHMPSHKPRVELSDKVPVSDKFRAEINEWLRQYFGEEPFTLIAEIPKAFNLTGAPGDKAIFCHPGVEREIRRMRDDCTGVFA